MPEESEQNEQQTEQLSPEDEELLDFLCNLKTESTMTDFQGAMLSTIERIQTAKAKGGFDISKIIPTLAKGENYCQGTFSQAWQTALGNNAVSSKTLNNSRWVGKNKVEGAEVSTNGAIEAFDKYEWKEFWPDANTRIFKVKDKNGKFVPYNEKDEKAGKYAVREDYKWEDCCFSIKDYPPGTTLRDMLWEGYNSDPQKIQEGALVLAPRGEEASSNSLHAMMFKGFDNSTPPKPVFAYANVERSDFHDNGYWTKYTANNSRCRAGDAFVVNMQKVASIEIAEAENEKLLEKGKDAYLTEFIKNNPTYATQIADFYKDKDLAYAEQITAFANGELAELSTPLPAPEPELQLPFERPVDEIQYASAKDEIHKAEEIRLAKMDVTNIGTQMQIAMAISDKLKRDGDLKNMEKEGSIRHTIEGNAPVTAAKESDRNPMTPGVVNRAMSNTSSRS